MIPRTTSGRRCSVITMTAAVVLLIAIAAGLPAGARASAIRPVAASAIRPVAASPTRSVAAVDNDAVPFARRRRDVPASADAQPPSSAASRTLVRKKRTLKFLKLKSLVVLPAKVAVGAGAKLVAGAKLGAKAVGLGAKALGVGAVGLKAVKKVAKVTVKAATALGVKAVLLNFLFQKINQVIDFKTRLLSNLDQRNRQQNAQFLSPVLSQPSSGSKSGSIGNKDDAAPNDTFVPLTPPSGFVAAAEDATGFVTTSSPTGFAPGSDLIASPPSPQQGFDGVPQNFGPAPPGFPSGPQRFAPGSQRFSDGPFGFASGPPTYGLPGFSGTDDDGSPVY